MINSFNGITPLQSSSRLTGNNQTSNPTERLIGHATCVDKVYGTVNAEGGGVIKVERVGNTVTIYLLNGKRYSFDVTPNDLGTAAYKDLFIGNITEETDSDNLPGVNQIKDYLSSFGYEWGELGEGE